MQLTKKEIIQKLYDIEEQENLKLGREVQKVVRNEIVPIEVISLINKYDKSFLQIYDTYNTIYNSRNRNPLYKCLKNKNLPIEELAISISSLVTKILISCSKIPDENDRKVFCIAMNLKQLNDSLTKYSLYNDSTDLVDNAKQVRELLQILYKD